MKCLSTSTTCFCLIRRTVVPIVVGAVAASALGPWLPDALVAEWATLLLASVYYIALRLLEVKVPAVSVLLGGKVSADVRRPGEEQRAFEDFIRGAEGYRGCGRGTLDYRFRLLRYIRQCVRYI
jgi:hypothetical protein